MPTAVSESAAADTRPSPLSALEKTGKSQIEDKIPLRPRMRTSSYGLWPAFETASQVNEENMCLASSHAGRTILFMSNVEG
jgi:hypothetical protein